MRAVFLFACIMLFSVVIGLSQSPPPVPTPTKSSQVDKHISDDKGADKDKGKTGAQALVPSVDKGGSNRETQSRADKENHGDDASSLNNLSGWLITAFTGFLALLAYLQWNAMRKQAEYMRRGLRISVRAARASKRAADAALSATHIAVRGMQIAVERERPRITVKADPLGLHDANLMGVSYVVDCWCPTPAFVVDSEVSAGIHLRTKRKEDWHIHMSIPNQILQTQKFVLIAPFIETINSETIRQIDSEERVVHFYGFITYRGVHLAPTDPPYRTSFNFRWMIDEVGLALPEFDSSEWVKDGSADDNQNT
jgi:hypothetical protein